MPNVNMGDGLTQYLKIADETVRDQLASNSPLVAVLLQFDEYLRRGLWTHDLPKQSVAFVLFFNAYQLYLASARMALSGHPGAVFSLLRTALESASYGLLIEENPEHLDKWINRHTNDDTRRDCRKTFTFEKAVKALEGRAPEIYEMAKQAYDGAIDYGAHPNVKGVFGHVSIDETRADSLVVVTHTSLYGSVHTETIRGLCACLDFGLVIISIISLAGPKISKQQIAELQALNDLKNAATDEFCSLNGST